MESVALAAVQASGLPHEVLRHGPVRDLAGAAQARGVEPADERLRGRRITLGAGAHGVAVALDADAAIDHLRARVGDVSD